MTVSVVKTTKGKTFGGFTARSWDSSSGYKQDPQAFLFSLDLQAIYPITDHTKSINCSSGYGPIFGAGHDLKLYNAFNSNSNYANPPSSYNQPKTASGYSVMNDGECNFTCVEVEVYLISV